MTTSYSTQQTVSSGSLSTLALSIEYLDRSEISVYINDLLSSAWSWTTPTSKAIQFTDAPLPLGTTVLVRRVTDASAVRHSFTGGAQFTYKTLDEDFAQILHIAQEALEGYAVTDLFNDLNMHQFRITGLGEALSARDAVPLQQVQNLVAQYVPAYSFIGEYLPTAGLYFTRYDQTLRYNSNFYAPSPTLTLPYTTTAVAGELSNFRNIGDALLRSDLAAADGAERVGYGVSTVGATLDVLEGKVYDGLIKEQRTFADFELLSNIGNTARINTAILGGVARIALVGDSILEGDRDGLYDNSAAAILMRVLREQNKDVTFTFANFSLAGRGIAAYSDPNYKGIASPDNPAVGFYRPAGNALTAKWPGGSVIGKSWIDHVKDFAPDLTIIMHGANDVSGVGSANAAAWKSALDYQNTWAKVPSVAMGTAALPAVSAGYQSQVQTAADVVRGIARERNHTLIDVNRVFLLHREGIDVDNLFYTRSDNFVAYPTGWVPDAGATLTPTDGTGYALQGVGGTMRNLQSQDVSISAKFNMPNWATQTGSIRYRSTGSLSTQYSAQVTSGAVFLYYGATIIGSAAVSSIPNNTEATLQVDVRGALHKVYLNGIEVISVYDYSNLRQGTHGVAITGASGLVYELIAHLGNSYVVGEQTLTDVAIYGVNDFTSNPASLGGNGINHPTKLANTVIWGHSFAPLIHHIRALRSASLVDAIPTVRAVSTEVFDTSNTTLQMDINGVIGLPTGILVTPTGAQGSVADVRKVLGGQTITVRVFHSPGAFFLSTPVVLPAGTWLVTANATFTKDATPTYRNTLIVTAVRTT